MLGNLFGNGLCRVVELLIAIVVRHAVASDFFAQMAAEGFGGREEHHAIACEDRIALHEVEIAVRVGLVVVVQAVQVHQREQSFIFQPRLGDIGKIDTCCVREELDFELEFLFLHLLRPEVIDVAHHEVPVSHDWRASRIAQGLHNERLRIVLLVGRKFAHLISLAAIRIFECHCQHLVRLQGRAQRDEAEGSVEGIFARGKQFGIFQLLIVLAAFQSDAVE